MIEDAKLVLQWIRRNREVAFKASDVKTNYLCWRGAEHRPAAGDTDAAVLGISKKVAHPLMRDANEPAGSA